MGSYSVIVFLGKFEGILVKPCLEQSTITPSLAQWHLSGQVKSAAQTVDEFSPTRTEINTIITQDFILILVDIFSRHQREHGSHDKEKHAHG